MVGEAIVDDIDYYNRVYEMVHILSSREHRNNDEVEGFGPRWDHDNLYNGWTQDGTARTLGGTSMQEHYCSSRCQVFFINLSASHNHGASSTSS